MLWYKIGNRFIDLHKVEEFGYSSSDTIHHLKRELFNNFRKRHAVFCHVAAPLHFFFILPQRNAFAKRQIKFL